MADEEIWRAVLAREQLLHWCQDQAQHITKLQLPTSFGASLLHLYHIQRPQVRSIGLVFDGLS
jgi:hypothetical protein